MMLTNKSGRIFFVRKIKVSKKDNYHLFVGEMEANGRIRGVTIFPKSKANLNADEIIYIKQ